MHAAHPDAALEDFAAELQGRAGARSRACHGRGTLATMHAAKGLEWDAVLLPGLVEGVMPIVYARTPEATEEERRLLYVAVTRARERLYLSWPAARGPGARPAGQPSRYLAELRPRPPAPRLSRRGHRPDSAATAEGALPLRAAHRPAGPAARPVATRRVRDLLCDTRRSPGPAWFRWAGNEAFVR